MIAHKDSRPRLSQVVVRIINVEPDASESEHSPLEAASCRPLAEAAIANNVETCRCDGAVDGADYESEEGRQAATVELDVGLVSVVSEQAECLSGVDDDDRHQQEPEEEDVHFGRAVAVLLARHGLWCVVSRGNNEIVRQRLA